MSGDEVLGGPKTLMEKTLGRTALWPWRNGRAWLISSKDEDRDIGVRSSALGFSLATTRSTGILF